MEAKILIVDDEMVIRKLLSRYLEDAGYTCRSSESVDSAKDILAAETFDLLLCDLKMPGGSGMELIQHAKKNYPQMGRIMITAFGSPEIASEIMTVGVYGYIIKPVTRNVVLITVENALRHLRLDLHLQACKVELERNISNRTEKLDAIMNNLNVGVVMLDPDLKIMEVNRTMQRWFPGISPGKTIPGYEHEAVGGDQRIVATLRKGKTREEGKRLSTAQGEKDFKIVMSPIRDKDGGVYAGIGLYDDITETMLLERDLRQAQKLEAVGQLAAGIAHEINTPVQYIGDNISFLKDSFEEMATVLQSYEGIWLQLHDKGLVSEEMGRKISEAIGDADLDYLREEIPKTISQSLEGVRRVDKIVRAMKDFSHPGSDEKMAADINKILESTITVCRNEWKYVAEMETDFAANLPSVPCYAGEISQVFLNIIVNGAHAINDFTEGGTKGLGKISIATRTVEDAIEIRIGDTGGGIPKKIQERVFDPFFTTKPRGKGTGQGLAIAHRVVVNKHQGTLVFEVVEGQGTTFVIRLPTGRQT